MSRKLSSNRFYARMQTGFRSYRARARGDLSLPLPLVVHGGVALHTRGGGGESWSTTFLLVGGNRRDRTTAKR